MAPGRDSAPEASAAPVELTAASADRPSGLTPAPTAGVALRRLGRATVVAAAALAGTTGAPAVARADQPAPAPERADGAAPRAPQTFAETSLAPSGNRLTLATAKPIVPRVRVFEVAEDGQRGPSITVSDKSRAARLGGTQVRGGATAVAFVQHLGGERWEPRVAYRPAGAADFLPAIAAGPVGTQAEIPKGFVALGPDGSGVVYGYGFGPGYTVKRLHADGTLGAPIVVAPRAIGPGSMKVAFARSGALVVAIRTTTEVPADAPRSDPTYRDDFYATTLPAGADRATPLEHLEGDADPIAALQSIAHSVGASIRAPDEGYLQRFGA